TLFRSEYYFISNGAQIWTKNGRFADLQQRKSAFDCFFERTNDLLPRRKDLCRKLHRRLSEMAMMHAHTAFNEGQMEQSRELSDFALAVCPEIRRSSTWLKLACKRRMGARTWRAVIPAAAAIRA